MKFTYTKSPEWHEANPDVEKSLTKDQLSIIKSNRDQYLLTARKAIEEYLNEKDILSLSVDSFPSTQILTGSYYLDRIKYYGNRTPSAIEICVQFRFLGKQPGVNQTDYLGAEVWLRQNMLDGAIENMHSVNLSAI